MKLSRKNQGNFLISKEFYKNVLCNGLPLGLQAKYSFMLDVFRIFRQLAKFQSTLAGFLNKRHLMEWSKLVSCRHCSLFKLRKGII